MFWVGVLLVGTVLLGVTLALVLLTSGWGKR